MESVRTLHSLLQFAPWNSDRSYVVPAGTAHAAIPLVEVTAAPLAAPIIPTDEAMEVDVSPFTTMDIGAPITDSITSNNSIPDGAVVAETPVEASRFLRSETSHQPSLDTGSNIGNINFGSSYSSRRDYCGNRVLIINSTVSRPARKLKILLISAGSNHKLDPLRVALLAAGFDCDLFESCTGPQSDLIDNSVYDPLLDKISLGEYAACHRVSGPRNFF